MSKKDKDFIEFFSKIIWFLIPTIISLIIFSSRQVYMLSIEGTTTSKEQEHLEKRGKYFLKLATDLTNKPFNLSQALTEYYTIGNDKKEFLTNDTIYKTINDAIYRINRRITLIDAFSRELQNYNLSPKDMSKSLDFELKCWKALGTYAVGVKKKESSSKIYRKYRDFYGAYFDYSLIKDSFRAEMELDSKLTSRHNKWIIIKGIFFIFLTSGAIMLLIILLRALFELHFNSKN